MAKGKSKKGVVPGMNKLNTLNVLLLPLLFEICIIALSIKYINELENCRCFLNKNPNNDRNVQRMIQIEYYFVFSLVLCMVYIATMVFLCRRIRGLEIFIGIVLVLSRLLQLYLVYLTFNVSRDISAECECSHSNLRYVLYFQALMLTISFLF